MARALCSRKSSVDAALHDSKEPLIFAGVSSFRPVRPAGSALGRLENLFARGRERRTLVEGHNDVGAELHLNFDRSLRREFQPRPVQMASEHNAFFTALPERGQTHDLISPAVGQEGPGETGETVKAPESLHQVLARSHMQVVSIRENDLRADLFEVSRR